MQRLGNSRLWVEPYKDINTKPRDQSLSLAMSQVELKEKVFPSPHKHPPSLECRGRNQQTGLEGLQADEGLRYSRESYGGFQWLRLQHIIILKLTVDFISRFVKYWQNQK